MTNLTDKFANLSSDVSNYINDVNTNLQSTNTSLDTQSQTLQSILSLLADINVVMNAILACVCRTADGIDDFLHDNGPANPCADAMSNGDALAYDWSYGQAGDWVPIIDTNPVKMIVDMAPLAGIPGAALNEGGALPGLILPGPKWYAVRVYIPGSDINVISTLRIEYGVEVIQEPTTEGEKLFYTYMHQETGMFNVIVTTTFESGSPPISPSVEIAPCTGAGGGGGS